MNSLHLQNSVARFIFKYLKHWGLAEVWLSLWYLGKCSNYWAFSYSRVLVSLDFHVDLWNLSSGQKCYANTNFFPFQRVSNFLTKPSRLGSDLFWIPKQQAIHTWHWIADHNTDPTEQQTVHSWHWKSITNRLIGFCLFYVNRQIINLRKGVVPYHPRPWSLESHQSWPVRLSLN